MTTEARTLDPDELSDEERHALQKQIGHLRRMSQERAHRHLRLQGDEESPSVSLPDVVADAMIDMLTELAAGHAVSIGAAGEELTTREAAELLNVSRPHLVKLLEEGTIPFHKVGTHRRVRRRDVLAYKTRQRERAEDAMQKLADQAQEQGLGYG